MILTYEGKMEKKRGGKRAGAGRPKKFKERVTVSVQMESSKMQNLRAACLPGESLSSRINRILE